MRRAICLGLLAGLSLSSAGCLVIRSEREVELYGNCREQVVVVKGAIYIVDAETNSIRKIDPANAIDVETLTETEIVTTEVE